jgi:hypothetical protein
MAAGRLNTCRDCFCARRAEKRQANRKPLAVELFVYGAKSARQYPKNIVAHKLVGYAKKIGFLVPGPCEVCGGKKVEAHHDDYDKPLTVRWMCPKHHKEWHRDERRKCA